MTDDSLEILWRGADPAKFTALQAALRDDGIQFWHTQAYDPAGGFLSSRPYYLEAVPGFEIRVHASDLRRGKEKLEGVGGNQVKFFRCSPRIFSGGPRPHRCQTIAAVLLGRE